MLGVLSVCIGTGPLGFLWLGWLADRIGAPEAIAVTGGLASPAHPLVYALASFLLLLHRARWMAGVWLAASVAAAWGFLLLVTGDYQPWWAASAALAAIAGLALTYRAGRRRQRRRHVALAVTTLAVLALAIVFAERMAKERVFPVEVMRVHLVFAKAAAAAVLPVAGTGLWLLRRARARRWHLLCVWVLLVLAAIATGTGIWAFSLSSPRSGG